MAFTRSKIGGLEWRSDDDPKGRNSTIIVRLELPPLVEGKKQLKISMLPKRLKIEFDVYKNVPPEVVVDAELARMIDPDESTWVIEDEVVGRAGGKRYLALHMAKKVDKENWPALFKEELATVAAPSPAAKPPVELTEQQKRNREAADLKVLKNLMSKLEAPAQAEIQKLIDQGIPAKEIQKALTQRR